MSARAVLAVAYAFVWLGGCTALISTNGFTGGDIADGSSSLDAERADGPVIGDSSVADAASDVADAAVDADGVLWTNGHRYAVRIYPSPVTWETARDDAVSAGGHLVTITSAREEAFIAALLNAHPLAVNQGYGPWIGAYQPDPGGANEPAGGWAWVTGEPWSYTNWASQEPNDSDGIEHYAHYFVGDGWNDISLDGSGLIRSAVVEYE